MRLPPTTDPETRAMRALRANRVAAERRRDLCINLTLAAIPVVLLAAILWDAFHADFL